VGLRFSLDVANWVSYLTTREAPLPRFGEPIEERDALLTFLDKLASGTHFYSGQASERIMRQVCEQAHRELATFAVQQDTGSPAQPLSNLRAFLCDRSWTALIVPSGTHREIDNFLCSGEFLRQLISETPDDPALILQLEEAPTGPFSLAPVFPAFNKAVAFATQWPGIIVWKDDDSAFWPLGLDSKDAIVHRAMDLVRRLGRHRPFTQVLIRDLDKAMRHKVPPVVSIIHMSDLHTGCREAESRLPRLPILIEELASEARSRGLVVPVITGDLLDSPDKGYLDTLRLFLQTFRAGTRKPILLLGNHDVRPDGVCMPELSAAINIPRQNIVWLEKERVAIACFNSVVGGVLARGSIGERQLTDLGTDLDEKTASASWAVVGALHHHPIPVEVPEWYHKPFYQRWLGSWFTKTVELEDSQQFMNFARDKRFCAILHGHEHIPRIATNSGVPIFGCGSTVGKVLTNNHETVMSFNLITIDRSSGRLSGQLLAETTPGAGLKGYLNTAVYVGKLQLT
jgi:hypothetical protein